MTYENVLGLGLLILLLLSGAMTAASEISFIAASRLKLRRLVSEGSKPAKIVLNIMETPEKFLGMILVVNNIIDTFIAAIMTAIMMSVLGAGGKSVIFATVIAAFFIIIFEVAAKTLAARRSERLALLFARPVRAMIYIFSPIVKVIAFITNFIIGLIGGKPMKKAALFTEEEIKTLLKIGEEEGVLHKEKYAMLYRIFEFSDTVVKDVMAPKKELVSISVDAPFEEIMYKVMDAGYSRVPVYKNSPDNIIGIINMKDLLGLSFNRELVVLQDIVYPATFVPASRKVTELLREFQKGHTHLAIVTDDENKVAGIVTLEDLLEEIVGEIEDEYDVRASRYKKTNA